jgi:hypothetical protein
LGKKVNNRIKICNGRITEIALCGGFVLTAYANGIENMFEIGKEIEIFRSKEEFLEKIRYYLENKKEREDIAQRGRARALRDYDSVKGFEKVFSEIEKLTSSEKIIYLDDDFIKNYGSYRFMYIVLFALNMQVKKVIEEFKIVLLNKKVSFLKSYFYILKGFSYEDRFPKLRKLIKKIVPIRGKY